MNHANDVMPFEVGDKVVYMEEDSHPLYKGDELTISKIRDTHRGQGLYLEGFSDDGYWWYAYRFQLSKFSPRHQAVDPQATWDFPKATPAATKDSNPKEAIGDKKVPLWLCSPIAKAHWSAAQFAGQVKYGSWNWRVAGVRSSTYLSAMQRHLDAYTSGEELDPVDQTKHLGNIMACAAILLDAQAAGKLNDDRPPSVGIREAYKEVERVMAVAKGQHGHLKPRNYTIEDTQHG